MYVRFLVHLQEVYIYIKFCFLIFLLFNIFQIVLACLVSLLVMLSGDIEVNPGTKRKKKTASQSARTLIVYLPMAIPNYFF